MAEAWRRRHRGLVGLVAAVAVLTGCASVPTSGPVHLGSVVPGSGGLDQVDIHVLPPSPTPGMSRSAIVTGFLLAQVDSDGGFAAARTYLAPGTLWRPGTSQTTYDESSLTVRSASSTSIVVGARRTGVITGSGYYLADPGRLRRTFTLSKVAGQWRISTLPDGVLLATADAARTQQLATLYFVGPHATGLVPQEVLLPSGSSGLATTLVDDIVAGARPPLSTVVPAVFPAGSQVLGNVPIDDKGVAEVDLPVTARALSTVELRALSAALVWTLRQLSDVTAVRLLAGGTPLSGVGVPTLQPISSWGRYDPDLMDPAGGVLVSDGHVHAVGLPVPAAFRGLRVRAPVLGADGTVAAALVDTRGRTALLTGASSGTMRSRITASSMTAPVIDGSGDVLVAVRTGHGSEIAVVDTTGKVVVVPAPTSVTGEPVAGLALSRDGTRVAVLAGPAGHQSVQVGILARTAHGLAVMGLTTVLPGSFDISSVAWSGAAQLVAVRQEPSGRQRLVESDTSGYRVGGFGSGPLPGRVTSLAAAPDRAVVVGVGNRAYRSVGTGWRLLTHGSDPSYTG